MAYFSQQNKKELAPAVMGVLKKYGVKATLGVHHNSSFVVNIKSSKHDFLGVFQACLNEKRQREGYLDQYNIGTYVQVNEYHVADQMRSQGREDLACFFEELISAMKGDKWFNNSDTQSDYFHIAYYLDINIGQWNKPYKLIK